MADKQFWLLSYLLKFLIWKNKSVQKNIIVNSFLKNCIVHGSELKSICILS